MFKRSSCNLVISISSDRFGCEHVSNAVQLADVRAFKAQFHPVAKYNLDIQFVSEAMVDTDLAGLSSPSPRHGRHRFSRIILTCVQ